MTIEDEIKILADAHWTLHQAPGDHEQLCAQIWQLMDEKADAEGERILSMTDEELEAECKAQGKDMRTVAAEFRAALLRAFDPPVLQTDDKQVEP